MTPRRPGFFLNLHNYRLWLMIALLATAGLACKTVQRLSQQITIQIEPQSAPQPVRTAKSPARKPTASPAAPEAPPVLKASPSATPAALTFPLISPTPNSKPSPQSMPTFSIIRVSGTPIPQPPAAISPENAGQTSRLARLGKGQAQASAWSPDGRFLAVLSGAGVLLYRADTLQELGWLEQDKVVVDLAFSPDGEVLALSETDEIRLFRSTDGSQVGSLNPPADLNDKGMRLLAFSPGAERLAGADRAGQVVVWDIPKNQSRILSTGKLDYSNPVQQIGFSEDGKVIGIVYTNGLRFWRARDGALIRTLDVFLIEKESQPVALSSHLKLLARGTKDGTVQFWKITLDGDRGVEAAALPSLPADKEKMACLAFSPDGQWLATCGSDETVRVWRTQDRSAAGILDLNQIQTPYRIWGENLSFSPDGQTLAIMTSVTNPLVWRIASGKTAQPLQGYTNSSDNQGKLGFTSDGKQLISAHPGEVRLWSMADGKIESEAYLLFDQMQIQPDGSILVADGHSMTGGRDDVLLQRVADGKKTTLWEQSVPAYARYFAFSPDGKLLAAGLENGAIQVLQVSDGALLYSLNENSGGIRCLAFSPDGAMLASCAGNTGTNNIRFWNAADGAPLKTLQLENNVGEGLTFSPDSRLLAVQSGAAGVQLYDISTGNLVRTLETLSSRSLSLAFSPDGNILAAGLEDGRVRLYRVADGSNIRTLEGLPAKIIDVAFSPDGRYLATLSGTGVIDLWGILLS